MDILENQTYHGRELRKYKLDKIDIKWYNIFSPR